MENKLMLLLGVTFSLAAIILIFIVINSVNLINESKTWLPAQAVVKHIEINKERGTKGKKSYGLVILYEFSANGKDYIGDTLTFGTTKAKYKELYKRKNKYKKGKKITIYHDPNNPERNVVEREGKGFWILGLMAFAFLSVGIFCIGFYIKEKRQANSKNSSSSKHNFSDKILI